jgi:hypothetical protein
LKFVDFKQKLKRFPEKTMWTEIELGLSGGSMPAHMRISGVGGKK